jgi:hypothetical protein
MLRLIVEHTSMSKKKVNSNDIRLADLKKSEKFLFDTYNWRANAQIKLSHLKELIDVITRIDELEKVNGRSRE